MIPAIVNRSESAKVDHRRPAELASDDYQRFIQQAAVLQIADQRGDRLIHVAGRVLVAHDVGVVIPAGVDHLYEPHPFLHKPPGRQATSPDTAFPVLGQRRRALFTGIEYLGRLGLHAEGDLHRLDSRLKFRRSVQFVHVCLVQVAQQIHLLALLR